MFHCCVVCCVLQDIRTISAKIASEVIKTAAADGHVECEEALEALAGGDEKLLQWVQHNMFTPLYTSLTYSPSRHKESE